MKTTPAWYEQKRRPEVEQVVHTVQQIVEERLVEGGLVLKILYLRSYSGLFWPIFNMAASKDFSVI